MSKLATPAHARKAVDRWNAKNPVGCDVEYTHDDGSVTGTTTRSEAQMLGGHTAVIWIESKSGCVALSRVNRREVR